MRVNARLGVPPAKLAFSILAFAGSFFSIYYFFGCVSVVCRFYIEQTFRFEINDFFALPSFVSGVILFVVLIAQITGLQINIPLVSKFHRLDYIILLTVSVSVIAFCYWYYIGFTPVYKGYLPLKRKLFLTALPPIAFTAAFLLAYTTFFRLKTRTLIKTVHWVEFYKMFPITSGVGIVVTILIAGNVLMLINAFDIPRQSINFTAFAFSLFTIVILSYLSVFLKSISKSYEAAAQKQVASERFKAELITNVSHDIKTPITVIINYIDLIQKLKIEDAALSEYTNILSQKADRLKELVNDLVEASKSSTGAVSLSLAQLDLAEFTGQIIGEYEGNLVKKGLTMVYSEPFQPVNINADINLLKRVMDNCFSNIIKYAMPQTSVFAELIDTENKKILKLCNVCKAPINIPAEQLTEQFVMGDKSRYTEGSGLGLYISKNLCQLMGAEFKVEVSYNQFIVSMIWPVHQ